ncbi:MAG TPA: prenyltransferase/squalene oxidase repeat-containing protein [Methylomirabilota bacterium]|nr:prenyltransferase/squalene oxidase repeat-containing protein [Methylomirabilota bacterium]
MMFPAGLQFLQRTQNADGGWGAVPDRQSNTEATALAVLALASCPEAKADHVERGLQWLVDLQNADGSWPLHRNTTYGSWTTAPATLALASFDDQRAHAIRGARWLLGHRGRSLGWLASLAYRLVPEKMAVRLDPDLRAWSWTADGFSWVEPTAYALIALKKLGADIGRSAGPHIREAERLLYDRMCSGGGWNHGNSNAYGVAIPPYPETTALALIALQDRQTETPNRASLERLVAMLSEAESGLSLSWAILCFSVRGLDVAVWQRRLVRCYATSGFLGETRVVALALLALSERIGPLRLALR